MIRVAGGLHTGLRGEAQHSTSPLRRRGKPARNTMLFEGFGMLRQSEELTSKPARVSGTRKPGPARRTLCTPWDPIALSVSIVTKEF